MAIGNLMGRNDRKLGTSFAGNLFVKQDKKMKHANASKENVSVQAKENVPLEGSQGIQQNPFLRQENFQKNQAFQKFQRAESAASFNNSNTNTTTKRQEPVVQRGLMKSTSFSPTVNTTLAPMNNGFVKEAPATQTSHKYSTIQAGQAKLEKSGSKLPSSNVNASASQLSSKREENNPADRQRSTNLTNNKSQKMVRAQSNAICRNSSKKFVDAFKAFEEPVLSEEEDRNVLEEGRGNVKTEDATRQVVSARPTPVPAQAAAPEQQTQARENVIAEKTVQDNSKSLQASPPAKKALASDEIATPKADTSAEIATAKASTSTPSRNAAKTTPATNGTVKPAENVKAPAPVPTSIETSSGKDKTSVAKTTHETSAEIPRSTELENKAKLPETKVVFFAQGQSAKQSAVVSRKKTSSNSKALKIALISINDGGYAQGLLQQAKLGLQNVENVETYDFYAEEGEGGPVLNRAATAEIVKMDAVLFGVSSTVSPIPIIAGSPNAKHPLSGKPASAIVALQSGSSVSAETMESRAMKLIASMGMMYIPSTSPSGKENVNEEKSSSLQLARRQGETFGKMAKRFA